MGDGRRSTSTYDARMAAKRLAGEDVFAYSARTASTMPRSEWKAHETLDPKLVAGPASPHAGQVMRECMISDEHPDPTPIAVFFDVTGSMQSIPRTLQSKLNALHGLLIRKGYATDPQIMFGAIGDAYSDRVPLQVGQFESDNRMDENLENILLEGGGGGGNHESYDLALYFLARHTYLDPFEKHGKKGFAFIIGDERAYPSVAPRQVSDVIGDALQEAIPTGEIIAEVSERYHVFYVFATQGSYQACAVLDESLPGTRGGGWGGRDGDGLLWRPLLGQNAIELTDADAVCETIALTVGLVEGGVSLDDAMADLDDVGSSAAAREAAGKALATIGASASPVATSSGDLPGLED